MVRQSIFVGAFAALLQGGHGFRVRPGPRADKHAEVPLTAEAFVEQVQNGDLVADLTGMNFERSVAATELNVTGPLFTHMVAAAAPISTACSWWQNSGITPFYKTFAHLCGVAGTGRPALDAHIERVWALLKQAQASLGGVRTSGRGDRVLKTFVSPEWTFRRYPINNADYVEPLSYDDVMYIISTLSGRFAQTPDAWDDWLIVPGSIFWGAPYTDPKTRATRYMVFNTLPVWHSGNFVYHHNKFAQADNINKVNEIWGYEVVAGFPPSPGCAKYGGLGGRVCGTTKFLEWLATHHPTRPDFVNGIRDWGVKQPHGALIVNGLAVGMDICLDHRMTIGESARAAERLAKLGIQAFDIQFLVSSGMAFNVPESDGALSLHVRDGGVGLSADGIGGPANSHLFVKKESGGAGARWNDTKGVVHNVSYTSRGNVFNSVSKATLAQDFTEPKATLIRSWTAGCPNDLPSKRWCDMCSTGQDPTRGSAFNDYQYQHAKHTMCLTEAGNLQVLKLWATPIPLKPPQKRVVDMGPSVFKATTSGEDLVVNVVAR